MFAFSSPSMFTRVGRGDAQKSAVKFRTDRLAALRSAPEYRASAEASGRVSFWVFWSRVAWHLGFPWLHASTDVEKLSRTLVGESSVANRRAKS
jgi:hypothetical protein